MKEIVEKLLEGPIAEISRNKKLIESATTILEFIIIEDDEMKKNFYLDV